MLAIGMGKIIGATTLHTYRHGHVGELLPKTAKLIMAKKNFPVRRGDGGNAADETAVIEIVPSEQVWAASRCCWRKPRN